MAESIKRRIAGLSNSGDKKELKKLLDAAKADLTALRTNISNLVAASQNYIQTSAGLTISSTATKVKNGAAFTFVAAGTMGYKAVDTDLPALSGTIADGKSAGWAFYVDSGGTLTVSAKTADADSAAAAIALLQALAVPANKALIGWVVVSTSGATFVGGTTALSAGTATDLYFSFVGPSSAFAETVSALTLTE